MSVCLTVEPSKATFLAPMPFSDRSVVRSRLSFVFTGHALKSRFMCNLDDPATRPMEGERNPSTPKHSRRRNAKWYDFIVAYVDEEGSRQASTLALLYSARQAKKGTPPPLEFCLIRGVRFLQPLQPCNHAPTARKPNVLVFQVSVEAMTFSFATIAIVLITFIQPKVKSRCLVSYVNETNKVTPIDTKTVRPKNGERRWVVLYSLGKAVVANRRAAGTPNTNPRGRFKRVREKLKVG